MFDCEVSPLGVGIWIWLMDWFEELSLLSSHDAVFGSRMMLIYCTLNILSCIVLSSASCFVLWWIRISFCFVFKKDEQIEGGRYRWQVDAESCCSFNPAESYSAQQRFAPEFSCTNLFCALEQEPDGLLREGRKPFRHNNRILATSFSPPSINLSPHRGYLSHTWVQLMEWTLEVSSYHPEHITQPRVCSWGVSRKAQLLCGYL